MLWNWRNDPITRQIPIILKKKLGQITLLGIKVLLNNSSIIGEERGNYFGVIRFDKCDNEEYVYENQS